MIIALVSKRTAKLWWLQGRNKYETRTTDIAEISKSDVIPTPPKWRIPTLTNPSPGKWSTYQCKRYFATKIKRWFHGPNSAISSVHGSAWAAWPSGVFQLIVVDLFGSIFSLSTKIFILPLLPRFPSFVCFDQLILSPLSRPLLICSHSPLFLLSMRGLPIRRGTASSTASSSAHSLLSPQQPSRGPGVPGNPALGVMQSSIKVSSLSLVILIIPLSAVQSTSSLAEKVCCFSPVSGPYWLVW